MINSTALNLATGYCSMTSVQSLKNNQSPEESPQNLDDMIYNIEKALTEKKRNLNISKQNEDTYDKLSKDQFEKLNIMAKQDTVLRRVEKISKYIALPTPIIIGVSHVIANPLITLGAMVALVGAFAAKMYSSKKIAVIDSEYYPLKNSYVSNTKMCDAYRQIREKQEIESFNLEKQLKEMKEKRLKADAQVKDMAEKIKSESPSGESGIINESEYIVISGLKIDKKTLRKEYSLV